MLRSLYISKTGMDSSQFKLDVVTNNLANTNTTAFKKGRANFNDLMYQ
ncbi:MAG: flagellar basal body protein, partial [Microvirgula sp.]